MHKPFANLLCALVIAVSASGAFGADFPNKPLRFLVGFAPGSALDLSCRHWGQRLTARTGQQVVVDNRQGASGEIAMRTLIASPADGYTLMCMSAGTTVSSSKPQPPFDVRVDVSPIVQMTTLALVLYVNPKVPANNVAEFVAYAKSRPGALNYSSVGVGSITQLAFELFKQTTGIELTHIPFKGSNESVAAVVAGEVQAAVDTASVVRPHIESGRARALAVTSARRFPTMPNIPGMLDAGVQGIDMPTWSGMGAPANTPRDVVSTLNAHFNAIIAEPETRAFYSKQGYEPGGGSAEDFGRLLKNEVETWKRVVTQAKITLQ